MPHVLPGSDLVVYRVLPSFFLKWNRFSEADSVEEGRHRVLVCDRLSHFWLNWFGRMAEMWRHSDHGQPIRGRVSVGARKKVQASSRSGKQGGSGFIEPKIGNKCVDSFFQGCHGDRIQGIPRVRQSLSTRSREPFGISGFWFIHQSDGKKKNNVFIASTNIPARHDRVAQGRAPCFLQNVARNERNKTR